jgi:hypothetical protein
MRKNWKPQKYQIPTANKKVHFFNTNFFCLTRRYNINEVNKSIYIQKELFVSLYFNNDLYQNSSKRIQTLLITKNTYNAYKNSNKIGTILRPYFIVYKWSYTRLSNCLTIVISRDGRNTSHSHSHIRVTYSHFFVVIRCDPCERKRILFRSIS